MTIKFGKEYCDFIKESIHKIDYSVKGEWQRMYADYLNRIFNLQGKRVLDFGCALGSMASAMMDAGMDVAACEVDQWYKDECKFDNIKDRIHIYDGVNLKYERESFDCIHASQTMEHIPPENLLHMFHTFHALLKPNGILYFSVPDEGDNVHDPTHVSPLSKKGWELMMKLSGFCVATPGYELKWREDPMVIMNQWNQHVGIKE